MVAQAELLDGVIVTTQTGRQTLRVTDARRFVHDERLDPGSSTICEIDLSFAEEPSRSYKLRVFDGFIVDDAMRHKVVGLLELWLRNGPADGSILRLSTRDIQGEPSN